MSVAVQQRAINLNNFYGPSKVFLETMSSIKYGSITIETPEGEEIHFHGSRPGIHAHLKIYNWEFCNEVLSKGDIGLGESYMLGFWVSNNLTQLIQFGIQNQSQIKKIIFGSIIKVFFYRLRHYLNKNTKLGSRKNIISHYDLGNDFYKLWLDSTWSYSSALFDSNDLDFKTAQNKKYNRILDQLDIKPGDRILEIGCGWGGFIECASKRGAHVYGVTLSDEQYQFVQEKIKTKNLNAEVHIQDYRDIEGAFDHVVSIEMFEALGKEYWDVYFKKINKVLSPGGKAVIQTITINEEDFSSYANGTDFIQQYIFPGGMLPTRELFKKISEQSMLKTTDSFLFGKSYAKTLSEWHKKFDESVSAVRGQGFSEQFIKMWKFYLSYCEGGFLTEKLNVAQFTLEKTK